MQESTLEAYYDMLSYVEIGVEHDDHDDHVSSTLVSPSGNSCFDLAFKQAPLLYKGREIDNEPFRSLCTELLSQILCFEGDYRLSMQVYNARVVMWRIQAGHEVSDRTRGVYEYLAESQPDLHLPSLAFVDEARSVALEKQLQDFGASLLSNRVKILDLSFFNAFSEKDRAIPVFQPQQMYFTGVDDGFRDELKQYLAK